MPTTRSNQEQRDDQPLEGQGTSEEPAAVGRVELPRIARDVTVPAFFGRQDEDGKKWLEMFIRFAACHGWTPAYKLIFIVYYLRDTASVWFENQNFDSWDVFTREFLAVYGNDLLRSRRAEEELRTRAQLNGESCHDYVQIILKLCREYNPLMS